MPTIRSWIRFSITDQFVCTAVFFSNVFNREGSSESRSEFVGDFRAVSICRYRRCHGGSARQAAFSSRPRASSRTVRHQHTRHSTGFQHAERITDQDRIFHHPKNADAPHRGTKFRIHDHPLSGSPLFPHIPCVESTNHIRTSPSRLMMCTAARPSHPDRAAELRSCAPHASRMPLRFCRPPRPAASAGRLRHSEPPSAWRSARRLLPGAQHGAFCLALSTTPSAWRSARRLLPGSSSALSLALGTALSNRGGSGEDPARVP